MKLIRELHAQVWTVLGVALVLITLSGVTFTRALLAFAVSLVLHFLGLLLPDDEADKTGDDVS